MFFHIWWKNIFWSKNIFPLFSSFFPLFLLFFPSKHYYFYEKTWNQKKIFCFNFLSMSPSSAKCFHIWFDISKVTSVEKRELRKHFSALACSFLGLKNAASASKTFPLVPFFLPWLQKPFTFCPFFNLDNLGKAQITLETFFLRVARTIIPTKYYF